SRSQAVPRGCTPPCLLDARPWRLVQWRKRFPRRSVARFTGKRALVAGGGRGIGEATARRLADEGADVLLVARTPAEIESVADSIVAGGGNACAHAADVASPVDVDAAVA